MGVLEFKGTLDRDEIHRNLFISSHIYNNDIRKLDLSKVKFVDPYGMILTLHIIEERLNSLEEVIMPKSKKTLKYMARAAFLNEAKRHLTLESHEKEVNDEVRRNPNNKTLIDITKIENNQDIKKTVRLVFNQTQNILINDLFYDEEDVTDYSDMLAEILSNIPRHSKSHGYVCAQSYHYPKSASKYVSVCISDVGIGIKNSFEGLINGLDDFKALKLAVIEEKSSIEIRGERGGNGFKGIKEKIGNLGGSLYVKSGTAEIRIEKGKNFIMGEVPFFPGTQLQIILPEKNY